MKRFAASYQLFGWMIAATLTMSHVVYELSRQGPFDARLLIGFAALYFGTWWTRGRIYGDATTFFDIEQRDVRASRDELLVFGQRIEDLSDENRERRLLEDLRSFRRVSLKVYGATAFAVALSIFWQNRFHGLSFLDVAAPVVMLSGILFAAFFGQILLPLLGALALALYGFASSNDRAVSFVFVTFLILFGLALGLMREISADRVNRDREGGRREFIKSIFPIVALFVMVYTAVDFFLPEENPLRFDGGQAAQTQDLAKSLGRGSKYSTDRLSRDAAEGLLKWRERAGAEKSNDRNSDGATAPSEPSGTEEVSRKEEPKPSMPSQNEVRDEPPSKEEASKEKSAHGAREGEGKRGAGGDADNGDGAGGDKGTKNGGSDQSGVKTSGEAANQKAPQVEREKKIQELQRDIKVPIEIIKGLLLAAAAGLVVWGLARYMSKPMSEESPLRRQYLSAAQKRKLEMALRLIRSKRLKAEEEVVETYNALLAAFEMGHYPREEWLPAEDFSSQIGQEVPVLKEPFSGATETFSRTLYGQKPVAASDLEEFRGDVAQILGFFEVRSHEVQR